MPGQYDNTSFFGTPHYNVIHPQLLASNLDLPFASLSEFHHPRSAPTSNRCSWNTSYFQSFGARRSEIITDPNSRQHTNLYFRVFPEDEVAILEIPSYVELRNSFDPMSYETELSEEFVRNNLKTKSFTSMSTRLLRRDPPEINLCVICQGDYENEECIGQLDCRHEYHEQCISKWLLVKNTCPVCKSAALSVKKTTVLRISEAEEKPA
ncbi:probable E3 ubiquitin-protein ligase ZFP1 isoform X2 [Andrographis paniculata]|nr:probable E3 ubiquitin-protein ligase ZFP1 isoform X2 [Andrographis paniculata]